MQDVFKEFLLDDDSPLQKDGISYEDDKLIYNISGELDRYILDCGKSISLISTAIDKANQCLTILDYDYIDSLTCDDYNLSEYIEFHIETYIIRAHSIYDRTLIFTNKLLQLGIKNSQIGHELIVSNENTISFGLNESLKKLKKVFKTYHDIRNSIIHHDRYKDDQFDMISLVHKTESLLKSLDRDPMIEAKEVELVTKNFVQSKKIELNQNLEEIKEKLSEFLYLALEVYKHKKQQLKT